jgi:hypothetical protein
MKVTTIIRCIFLTLAFLLFVKSASAQQIAINLKPGSTKIVTKPGKTISYTMTLINSGDPQVYTLRLYSIEPIDQNGNFRLLPLKNSKIHVDIVAPYIHLNTPFLMHTNTKEELPVHVEVPGSDDDSLDGEYMYAIVAEGEKPLPVEGNVNIRLSPGLGSILFVKVLSDNTDTKNVEVPLFKAVTQISIPFGNTSLSFVDSGKPIPFSFLVKNKGTNTITPQGVLSIRNIVTKNAETFTFKPAPAYPNQDRLVTVQGFNSDTCQKNFSEDNCSSNYSFVHPGFVFGLFEATSRITFGGETPVIYSSTFFIVVPFILVVLMLIGMTVSLVLLIHWWKKHLHQATHQKHHK